MNAYRVKPLRFPWTPLAYMAAALLAMVLARLYPLRLDASWHMVAVGAGALAIAAGLWLVFWGYGKLLRSRPRLFASSSAGHLVTSGPYRFSRNPVYLGYTLVMTGCGFVTGNTWLTLGAILTMIITHAWVVRSEERLLLARFGFEFECYCRRTRAWI